MKNTDCIQTVWPCKTSRALDLDFDESLSMQKPWLDTSFKTERTHCESNGRSKNIHGYYVLYNLKTIRVQLVVLVLQ